MRVRIKKLDPRAQIPRYIRGEEDAALDLHCLEGCVIPAGQGRIFDTGLAFEIPPGTVGLVCDRGGLAFKNDLTTVGGVLDPGYRGDLRVKLFNLGQQPYEVQAGERIAQLIIANIGRVELEETDNLSETKRGSNAYGSSGR